MEHLGKAVGGGLGGGAGAAGTRAPLPRTGIGFSWKSLEFPNGLWLCAVFLFFSLFSTVKVIFFSGIKSEKVDGH